MTVSSTENKISYSGDGSTTGFAIPFAYARKSDIVAILRESDGTEVTYQEGTHYTLTVPGASGTLTVISPPTANIPAAGETLTIKRVVPLTQETDYPQGGAFPSSAHEGALDKLTHIAQQLQEVQDRTLQFPATDTGGNQEIPNETDRASKFLSFDAGGAPIVAAGTSADLGPVSAFIDTLLDDADAATARATLGLVIGTDVQADLDVPSQTEAEIGTATAERVWTAQRVAQAIAALAGLPRSYLTGLGLANNGTDADHDVDIAVGEARDDADAEDLKLTSALTKQIDAAWAVGTDQGGLDTGTVAADTWYHVWLIKRTDTGVVDALFSTSATSPTMPSGYDAKRRIGSVLTDGSANIIAFTAREKAGGALEVLWDSPVGDLENTSTGNGGTTTAITVPAGIVVDAKIRIHSNATTRALLVTPLDVANEAPAASPVAAPGFTVRSDISNSADVFVHTNTSAQIRVRSDGASDAPTTLITLGWIDERVS